MKSSELLDRLERHYIKPGKDLAGGVFVRECGINGGSQSRCDAVYVGFTSTSGRLLVGHELKVSRSDWLRELAQSGKADVWHDACHEWWIVAPGPDVVPKDELPAGWGLMYPTASKTVMRKIVVPERRVHDPSWVIVRSILARLDTLQRIALGEVHAQSRATLDERVREQLAKRSEQTLDADTRHALDWLREFEALIGRRAAQWSLDGDHITPEAAARLVEIVEHEQRVTQAARSAHWSLDAVERTAAEVTAATKALREALAAVDRVGA